MDRRRKELRLPTYDYRTPGPYFITICTHLRNPYLGCVRDAAVVASEVGAMVQGAWTDIPVTFPEVHLDAFVLMPNHVHGVLFLDSKAVERNAPVGDVVGWFKTVTTNRSIHGVRGLGWPPFDGHVWQRNFYEHIVRNDADLDRIRAYIENNPATWMGDSLHVP